jgi:hypothetical protein
LPIERLGHRQPSGAMVFERLIEQPLVVFHGNLPDSRTGIWSLLQRPAASKIEESAKRAGKAPVAPRMPPAHA